MGRSFFSISFERMSKYNFIRGEAFISGECVSVIEDSGFANVEQVITKLLSSLTDGIPRPTKVQIKITNLDKRQVQLVPKSIVVNFFSLPLIDRITRSFARTDIYPIGTVRMVVVM